VKRFKVGGCRPEAAATLLEAGSAIPERQRPEKSGDALLPQWPEIAEEGGLVAYGPRFITLYRQHALQAVKVLKETRPSDIPVEQLRTLELVINLRTAKALGLTIPPSLLARADEAIE